MDDPTLIGPDGFTRLTEIIASDATLVRVAIHERGGSMADGVEAAVAAALAAVTAALTEGER